MSESQTPSLSEVIEAGIDESLDNFITAIPVNILYWNSIRNEVDIEVAIVNANERPDGKLEWNRSKLYGVPVLFPGSGKNRMTFPLKVNSPGLYIVSTLPTHDYRDQGSDKAAFRIGVNVPLPSRNNVCNKGYVIPGLYYSGDTQPATSEDDLVITAENKLKLGDRDGTEPTFRANQFLTRFNSFLSVLEVELNAVVLGLGTTIRNGWDASSVTTATIKTTKVEVK